DPAWSPDGRRLAFTAFPGPRVMTAEAAGGAAQPLADGLAPAWSPDGKAVAYFSSEPAAGFGPRFRIVVRPAPGGPERRLRSAPIHSDYSFRPSLDWSPDGQRLLTVQLEDGRWQPVVIDVEEARIERLVRVPGSVIGPRWSHDARRIAYASTDTGHPPSIEALTLESGQRISLTPPRSCTSAQLVSYGSAGGLEIPGWLYLPPDAGGAKRPAIVWLHGATPGAGAMRNEFAPSIQYFVDQGFVVLAPNYRGSAGFGEALARFDRGDDMLPDVVAGVAFLRGLPSVDAGSIGVVGFSFGGYLTLRVISEDPELFAAAVDFYGPSDLAQYYRDNEAARPTLSRLLGGSPEENAAGYRAASPINFVDR